MEVRVIEQQLVSLHFLQLTSIQQKQKWIGRNISQYNITLLMRE